MQSNKKNEQIDEASLSNKPFYLVKRFFFIIIFLAMLSIGSRYFASQFVASSLISAAQLLNAFEYDENVKRK